MPTPWLKLDVDMPRDPRLFGRPVWERHFWNCLQCTTKEFFRDTAIVRGYDAGELARLYNLGVSAKEVKAALAHLVKVGLVKLLADGGVFLLEFHQKQKDPTNAFRQARFRASRNSGVTVGVTGGPLPEGEGERDRDLDTNRGGSSEASKLSGGKAPPPSGKAGQNSELSLEQLEGQWPDSVLERLHDVAKKLPGSPRARAEIWLQFLRKVSAYDEPARVAAARKYLERDANGGRGKNLDYLHGMIRSMAGEVSSPAERSGEDERHEKLKLETRERAERQERELAELRLERQKRNGNGVPNGAHKRP